MVSLYFQNNSLYTSIFLYLYKGPDVLHHLIAIYLVFFNGDHNPFMPMGRVVSFSHHIGIIQKVVIYSSLDTILEFPFTAIKEMTMNS